MSAYTAKAVREGRWWVVTVPELGGRATQVRRLDQVDEYVRDLIGLFTDDDATSAEVHVKVGVGDTAVQKRLDRALVTRQKAVEVATAAAEETRGAAVELQRQGLSVRDIGVALGVSFQRAQQLVSPPASGRSTRSATVTAGRKPSPRRKAG